MDKNIPIIIPEILNESPICDFIPQTSQVLSHTNPVYIYFVNFPKKRFEPNILKQKNNLYFVYPLQIFPFVRFQFIRNLNNIITFSFLYLHCFFKHHLHPIYWFFYPQLINLIKFSPKPQKLIYDIVDSFSSPNPKIAKKINLQKKYLLTHADIVTAISRNLIKISQNLVPNVKIKLVPQGFYLDKNSDPHPEIQRIKKLSNKVGFIGGIGNRLDFKILFNIISKTPKMNYIFIGPVAPDYNTASKPISKLTKKLFSFSNVYHIDTVAKNQIHQFISVFNVCIIPYDITQSFNRDCYPMKLFEYFSEGKPVITSAIEELKYFPDLVKIGHNSIEWINFLEQSLPGLPPKLQQKAKRLAQKNSWKNKINKTISLF